MGKNKKQKKRERERERVGDVSLVSESMESPAAAIPSANATQEVWIDIVASGQRKQLGRP